METVMRVRAGTVARLAPLALVALVSGSCSEDVSDVRVPEDAQSLTMEEVYSVHTHWSSYEDPVRTVIADEESWSEAWETLHATVSPVPQRPEVDFDTSLLVLAAMGQRPSTGYSVTIEDVKHHDGVLYVALLERSPGPACINGGALTAPAHVVQVPRVGTEVAFDVRRVTYAC